MYPAMLEARRLIEETMKYLAKAEAREKREGSFMDAEEIGALRARGRALAEGMADEYAVMIAKATQAIGRRERIATAVLAACHSGKYSSPYAYITCHDDAARFSIEAADALIAELDK